MSKLPYKARYFRVVLPGRTWRPMRLLRWATNMPSGKQYNLVTNDDCDTRIPLHADEAFHYGITFSAKYIGSMEVPRPTSRVEIVAAMRRVRYEFKAKGVKKRKVTVDVSTDGVRVTTRKKTSKGKKKARNLDGGAAELGGGAPELMHHPIYRIFYVSHDSSDLKIFSYIARDPATNAFKCNVFKSNKKTEALKLVADDSQTFASPTTLSRLRQTQGKQFAPSAPELQHMLQELSDASLESQAMRIVRTVGQAFDVCHKMQADAAAEPAASTSSVIDEPAPSTSVSASDRNTHLYKDAASEVEELESVAARGGAAAPAPGEGAEPAPRPASLGLLPPPPKKDGGSSPKPATPSCLDLPECLSQLEVSCEADDATTPLTAQHQLQLLRERLQQQSQHTRAAVAQLLLLRDQLAAEKSARCEAQARTHQLLVHNKELLEHIAALVAHLQVRERGAAPAQGIARPISAHQLTLLPQQAGDYNTKYPVSNGNYKMFNPSTPPINNQQPKPLVNCLLPTAKHMQNYENNNLMRYNTTPTNPPAEQPADFSKMTNEQIQTYLISKFPAEKPGTNESSKSVNYNQHFFQNSNAFPNIPPLVNLANDDISSLLNSNLYERDAAGSQASAMSLGRSQGSLYSDSPPGTSKESTPDGCSSEDHFIMPLSHKGTLRAQCEDGRVKLIVPVSPSSSVADIGARGEAAVAAGAANTLRVPLPAPILRTTSEKVPNRSEMMTALRSQWTRHTTK